MNETPQPTPEFASDNTTDTNHGSQLSSEPRAVLAGRGLKWLTEAWALIMKEPAVFIAMSVISLVAIFVINLVPLLGSLAVSLLWPAMMAGFFLAFKHAKQRQSVTANDLFEPFKAPASLIAVGGMYVLAGIVLMLVLGIIAFISIGSITELVDGQINIARMGAGLITLVLVSIPAALALAMAFMFAPVLVHEHQVPVIEAIKRSFSGSLRNILPFVLFFFIWFVFFIIIGSISIIPLIGWLIGMLAMIIYLPLFCGALFCAYNDIFLAHSDTEL